MQTQTIDKALIILSGGMDSATCLALACQHAKEVHTISFWYGQRHGYELECAAKLSSLAGVESHTEIECECLNEVTEGITQLTNFTGDISGQHPIEQTLPASFVPGRNAFFLTLSAIHAYKLGLTDIYMGVCQADYSGYPDCRLDFIQSMEDALQRAMQTPFLLHVPLMNLTKAETVGMMKEMGKLDWYAHTHTCYEGQRPPCGKCPSCKLRMKGFDEAGIPDPLQPIKKGESEG